jgi:geranylgeranyl pyrophosphate synthase
VKLLSSTIGLYGMIGGQIEDMYFEKNISSLDEQGLESLHNKKTGKLIQASLIGGVILA